MHFCHFRLASLVLRQTQQRILQIILKPSPNKEDDDNFWVAYVNNEQHDE
jgi:hypothetical protein